MTFAEYVSLLSIAISLATIVFNVRLLRKIRADERALTDAAWRDG